MSVSLDGDIALLINIERLANDFKRQTMKALRADAITLRDLARRMSPLEYGSLESAIKVDTVDDGNGQARDALGRFGIKEIVIYVDPDEPAPDRAPGVTVGEYALHMHEGSYDLGPLSQAKQAADPSVIVGPHFLERAAEQVRKDLMKKLLLANFALLA